MNVTTDPRIMKQLLLSQWVSGGNPLASSLTAGVDGNQGGDLFQLLLAQLMQDSTASEAGPVSSAPLPLTDIVPAYSVPQPMLVDQPEAQSGSSSAYDGLVADAATKYGIDPALIKGVIQTESSFHAGAESHAGAKGLMQLMDDTARGLGVTDSFDPAQNIDGGARFLSYLLRKYEGNVSSAVAAYNAGPGRVDRLGLTTDEQLRARLGELPQETQRYVGKVLESARRWGWQAQS